MAINELGYGIDTSQVLRASKDLDKLDQAEGRAAKTAGKLEGALLRAAKSAGVLAAATFSVHKVFSTISSFEKSMSGVQAVTRASAEEMEALRDVAKDLGATTEYTASQAAEGLRFLGMAGFSTAESIAAIPQVLDLATASSMDLATAADIASNMMSAYGIAATDAGRITDVLAAAASRANTDVMQMGDGMKYVGPVAAAMGISINDTAAAIGVLSDAGIQGSMAGTGLRRVMSSLANATPKAAKALRRMGLDINDLNPATNDLVDIVDRLASAGLSASDALTIFGDRGGPAILALVENNQKLRDLTSTLQDVDGEASKMAGTMRDNLQGSMDGLSSAIDSVIIAMGESGLTAVLRAIIDTSASAVRAFSSFIEAANRITGVGSALGSAFEFLSGHIEVVGRAITSVAMFMTGRWIVAFVAARAATVKMTASTISFASALVTLRGALVRTGIGALVVAAGELTFYLGKVKDASDSASDAFNRLFNVGKATFVGVGKTAWGMFDILAGIASMIVGSFTRAFSEIARAWDALINGIGAGWNFIADTLGLQEMARSDLSGAMRGMADGLFSQAADQIRRGGGRIKDAASDVKSAVQQSVMDMAEGAEDVTSQAASSVTDIVDAAIGGVGDAGGGGGGGGSGGVLDRLKDDFQQLRESLLTELESTNEWLMESEALLQAARHAGLIASEEDYLQYRERLHREYNDRLSQINGYYSNSALDQASTFFGDMAGAMQSGNEKMLKISQTFSAAQALINTWKGYTDALAQGGMHPLEKLAWGAKILAAGFGAIKAIKGVSSSGSSNAKQAAQASAPAASAPQRTVNLTVQGEYFTGDTIQRIAEGLNDFIADGGNINVVRA